MYTIDTGYTALYLGLLLHMLTVHHNGQITKDNRVKEILLLAPTRDIYEKARAIVHESDFANVGVILASMGDGLAAAEQACRDGTSILISRGGTYEILCKHLDVPIVEIKVTAYDLIDSIKPLLPEGGPIGVMGYKNVVYGFDILASLLPVEIVKFEISCVEDVARVTDAYRKLGVSICVGDANIEMVAEQLHCPGIYISSRKLSIREAIEESRRILTSIKTQKHRSQQIIAVTDFMHDGIIAIDKHGTISICNHSAEKIFNITKEAVLGRDIRDVLPGCRLYEQLCVSQPQVGYLLPVGNTKVVINRTPVLVDGTVAGAVATFQDVSDLQHVEQKIRRSLADKGFSAHYTFAAIVHASDRMEQSIAMGREFAQYDTPVLIMGESGAGKEIFCQSIHNSSARRTGPFIAINCAAIPPSLIEAELFGYEQGAFTGAVSKGRAGIFELAHRGTVLLDEIGELPIHLQGRLLRVLAEKTIMRVGGDKMVPVDVRIICATNKHLQNMVHEGAFRRDLFYRINVLTLSVPSLNECGAAHILTLAKHFIQHYSHRYNKKPLCLPAVVERHLVKRRYEGNVRELKGLMERCVILASFEGLLAEMPSPVDQAVPSSTVDARTAREAMPALRSVEDSYIREVFHKTGRNCQETCKILKISRSTLWRRLGMADVAVAKDFF